MHGVGVRPRAARIGLRGGLVLAALGSGLAACARVRRTRAGRDSAPRLVAALPARPAIRSRSSPRTW